MQNITTICVCGAGTMGSGIAQVAASAGFKTIVFDVAETMLAKSKELIEKNLAYLVSKAKITSQQQEQIINQLVFTSNIETCVADLVIEAIIEKKEAKVNLFNTLHAINKGETIFASNTSSISITDISKDISNPSRVAGLHFFNPAPLMKLVEIIKGEHTGNDIIESLLQVCKQMNKTAVVCRDSPGFIVNRVARHYYLQAMKLVQEGKASIEDVDTIMEANGFKMGPFKLMDLIGLDINYSVSQIVYNDLGKPERLEPSPLQKQKVDAGELGKKTGKGFYNYS